MPYTPEKPKLVPSRDELKARIPDWGVDADPAVRPAVPKENYIYPATGAHWEFPDRQEVRWDRERSTEHKFLTPVFGTSCPLSGVSGLIRRVAYRRFSEGRLTHWMLLMLADRVNVIEGMVGEALRGRPDNVLAEYGVKSELTGHPIRSRFGRHRADTKRLPVDLMMAAGTWIAIFGVLGTLRRRRRLALR